MAVAVEHLHVLAEQFAALAVQMAYMEEGIDNGGDDGYDGKQRQQSCPCGLIPERGNDDGQGTGVGNPAPVAVG